MPEKNERTELSSLGEFGLIERLTKDFPITQSSTKLGVGDDGAVINHEGLQTVISSDMLTEGIHFDLRYVPIGHLGYKAVASNVSDIAAMNAIPSHITVNIGLSNRFSIEACEALYSGIRKACEEYNVDLIGGDTTSSASGLVISITAIGYAKPEEVVKRSTAKSGDIICATGDLGGAYMGLQILEREKEVFLANPDMQPDLSNYNYIVGRQLRPRARMDIIHELRELKLVPTSMIDVSDGLASELIHIGNSSNVGFNIYEDKLPLDKQTYETAVEFNIDPSTCALNGGEDYELLFTIDQKDHDKIKNHPDIHFIGYVQDLEKGRNLITKQQNVHPIKAQGWNHFKK